VIFAITTVILVMTSHLLNHHSDLRNHHSDFRYHHNLRNDHSENRKSRSVSLSSVHSETVLKLKAAHPTFPTVYLLVLILVGLTSS